MENKYCVLEENKLCDDCGRCSMCDLDPEKVCDNCMKCVNGAADYACIAIDGVFESENAPDENEDWIDEE